MKLKIIAFIIMASQIFAFANNYINQKNIVVYGQGELKAEPDIAIIDFIISSKGDTPQEAKTQNNKLSDKVKKIIDKNNIQKQNIKIKNNIVIPQNIYDDNGKIEKTFYMASQNVEITLTNISKESEFLDTLTNIGIEDITTKYQKSNIQQQVDLAMKEAINYAISKAKNMTSSANVTLGDILEIEEIQASPVYASYRMSTVAQSQQNLNGNDGVIEINAKVRIKFAIK